MLAEYLTRGVKAGLVAGVVFGLFMAVVANPLVVYADEMNHAAADVDGGHEHESEAAHAHGDEGDHAHEDGSGHEHEDGSHGHEEAGHSHEAGGHTDEGESHADGGDGHHDTAVSMAVNKAVSVISGGLWAVLLGGAFFGIAFYFLEPAIPGAGAAKSYAMGLAGFVTVSGAPWLVLPPASPGAQQSLPVSTRIPLYAGMMVAGALTCLLAGYVYNRLRASNGRGVAIVGGILPFGLLAIPAVLAPTNTIQGALSPELRTGMTGLFVFGQVLVWLLLAATHAQLRSANTSQTDPSAASRGATLSAD
ncbi:CbtA family protein [Haloferax larsenii]|uniref:Uncharacterized membrane protein, predicted cobalt tansporter CbtA n=1 Tax=Haloferax larsenii TaxID=302484 RepID=A0A1H7NMF9_HALLR|nr:CbtA family protein [Haloferax larsenii]SEL24720.1 Uncharacterized membrane protein, predicted cobalt tansporter CbtA [Haloferax larsenii]